MSRYSALVTNYLDNERRGICPLPNTLPKLWKELKDAQIVRFRGAAHPSTLESVFVSAVDQPTSPAQSHRNTNNAGRGRGRGRTQYPSRPPSTAPANQQASSQPSSDITCWSFGEKGHRSNACPKVKHVHFTDTSDVSVFLSTVEDFNPTIDDYIPEPTPALALDQILISSASKLGPTILSLDTQASIHLISNAELLYSIGESTLCLRVQGITKDVTHVSLQGTLKHLHINAYHSPAAAANILSYSKLKETHTCTYDPATDSFTAQPIMYGPTLQITNVGGHYSLNIGVVTNIYLSTIESKQHGFSKRQVTQARKAYDFIHRLGFVSYKDASEVVQRSSLSDLGFTRENLVTAQYIYGAPAAYQLGHGTTATAVTNTQPLIPTDHAQPQDLEVDLFFLFSQVFFISISRSLRTKEQGLIQNTDDSNCSKLL